MPRSQSPSAIKARPKHTGRGRGIAAVGAGTVAVLLTSSLYGSAAPAYAADPRVELGTAGSFGVLASSEVTNTGPSVVTGDVGVSPGSAVTGFPPGVVLDGTIHATDAQALQAQSELTIAFNDASSRGPGADVTGQNLGGMRLTPGVYEASTAMALTGTLTLDAQGDPDAVFVFKAGSTLVTASNALVLLVNGGSPCNVYWRVGSSATLGTNTTFVGNLLVQASAALTTGATVEGRVLARTGAVTLDTNTITRPTCRAVVAPPTSTPTATATPSVPASVPPTPGATATPRATPAKPTPGNPTPGPRKPGSSTPGAQTPGSSTPGLSTTPFIPHGHPPTGLGGAATDAVEVFPGFHLG